MLPQARYLAKCRSYLANGSLVDKNCLVLGGTNGIGKAIALQLSKLGANVTIAGRSKESGSNVLSDLRNNGISESQKHSFERVDLTSQLDTQRFLASSSSKLKDHGGLHMLFLTAGKPPNGKQSLTADGIEAHFALQCLGRYSAADKLSHVVNRGGCITVICAPGQGTKAPQDDLEYLKPENKSKYGMLAAGFRDSLYVDSVLMEIAEANKARDLKVLHLFPGGVNTTAAETAGFPAPIVFLARTFGPWVLTPVNDYSVTPVYEAMVKAESSSGGYFAKNQYGQEVAMRAWVQDKGNREACINYSKRRIAEALAQA